MSPIIPFGKHRFENIYSVYKVDRSYCKWLHEQRMFSEVSEIGRFLILQFGRSSRNREHT
jgi:hypothetical protein